MHCFLCRNAPSSWITHFNRQLGIRWAKVRHVYFYIISFTSKVAHLIHRWKNHIPDQSCCGDTELALKQVTLATKYSSLWDLLQALQTISQWSKDTKRESTLLVHNFICARDFATLASHSFLTYLEQKSFRLKCISYGERKAIIRQIVPTQCQERAASFAQPVGLLLSALLIGWRIIQSIA